MAGSLEFPLFVDPPTQPMQHGHGRYPSSAHTPGAVQPESLDSTTPSENAIGDNVADNGDSTFSNTDNLQRNLEGMKLDDNAITRPLQRPTTSALSPSTVPNSISDAKSLSGHEREQRRDRRDGDDDESMFAEITRSIYDNTDVNGVLILDSQVANSFEDSLYAHQPSRRQSSLGALDAAHPGSESGDISYCKEWVVS